MTISRKRPTQTAVCPKCGKTGFWKPLPNSSLDLLVCGYCGKEAKAKYVRGGPRKPMSRSGYFCGTPQMAHYGNGEEFEDYDDGSDAIIEVPPQDRKGGPR